MMVYSIVFGVPTVVGSVLIKINENLSNAAYPNKSPPPPNGENHMSKKAAEHHKKASEHLTLAARHHGEAAKHYETGAHEKAAHHAHIARGHAILAREHAEEAVKAHVEEHGKK
jgi:hypothetical protein